MNADSAPAPGSTPQSPSLNSPTRRDFLRVVGLGGTGVWLSQPILLGAPNALAAEPEFTLVPADKKLDPQWVRSLAERGAPSAYRGADLEKIGMPVGGICAGQLYLGGDGRLWHWDIFNLPQADKFMSGGGPNYAKPAKPESPLEHGFALRVESASGAKVRRLDSRGFDPNHIEFRGPYPMAFVTYKDPGLPLEVTLEAFSPFIPLNVADSSLPATILHYTIKNTSQETVSGAIAGWLQNGVCLGSGRTGTGLRRNRATQAPGLTLLHCTAEPLPEQDRPARRPDILFDDFENGYAKWKVEGEAFGTAPATGTLPNQQPVSGFLGSQLVNSFLRGDGTVGRMTSQPFTLERRCIAFLIGGGQGRQTAINLLVNGKAVRSAHGRDNEHLDWTAWEVSEFAGREARLEIVDQATGAWGHINVDQILFCDEPPMARPLTEEADFGSLGLALLGEANDHFARRRVSGEPAEGVFREEAGEPEAAQAFGADLVGAVGRRFSLQPGQQAEATFVLAWWFPRLQPGKFGELLDSAKLTKAYGKRFASAEAVARYVTDNFARLAGQTRLWHQTWQDSTLPHWFLERTFSPISTLATSTCYQFDNGRFYAFEGVYCCAGTCQHVWNYAQSVARIFPELERDLRQRTDFGTAWHDNGAIDYRGEAARHVAHDGQCGVILRAYREHQTAADSAYLRACWPHIRKSVEYLIGCDGDENGLIEGEQYNTLDASWWGPMAWISSLYIAALRAGEAMAKEMGDADFAARCARIAQRGSDALVKDLYNGEYFIHKPDPKHPDTTNTNQGCHIDQLMGQAWALQVALPRVVPWRESGSALEAIWKYNFAPDAGGYRNTMQNVIRGGRWYAMPGEGGVVMTTFPRGGAATSSGKGGFAYYFNEVWTGQEHQLAAHMMWEHLVEKALVITRTLHDRHHPSRRNPYNEVECSDHYSRAMSSHGTFLAACGYEYHGPQGHLGFAPRLTPENFRAPFTAAEGWGTFTQTAGTGRLEARIEVRWGQLRLRTLALAPGAGKSASGAAVSIGSEAVPAVLQTADGKARITFGRELLLTPGRPLVISLT